MKKLLFMASAFLTLSATSQAAPFRGGFHGGSFHGGFVAHGGRPALRMDHGIGRAFAFRRGHRVFIQQFAWPVYCYPYDDPFAYSYLDYGPDYDYQYRDDSGATVQPESFRRAADNNPTVIVINAGNSRPADSSSNNSGYANTNYGATDKEGQQRIVVQASNAQMGEHADTFKGISPTTQPVPPAAQATQAIPQLPGRGYGKFVLLSWLNDSGKDVLYVQNTETNEVEKITSEPNRDNFRIVEVHPNADPKEFEATISNGSEQIPVRFRF